MRDGGDWRGLVPPAVAAGHRRPPRRPCARSSSCCLTASGDRADADHGGRTANEAACTPNLDALAAARLVPACSGPLGPGRAPSSEVAHWAILGYRAVRVPRPRGPRGPRPRPGAGAGEVLAHAALRPPSGATAPLWVTGRAGPGDGGDARTLLAGIPRRAAGGARARSCARSCRRGARACCVVDRRRRTTRVTDSDPFFRDRHPDPAPAAAGARRPRRRPAPPSSGAAARCAPCARHPANAARRAAAGPLDAVTLKWWGRPRAAPDLPRAPRPRRRADRRRLAVPRRPGGDHRPALRALRRGRRPGRRPAASGSRWPRTRPRRRRHLRLLPPQGHRRGRPHQGPGRQAAHDRGRRRRRSGGLGERFADAIVCVTGDHATPTVARGHPLRGPGAVPAGRARRPRRPGRALRGARLRRGPARAASRGRT